jgi:hypothetical protein
MKRTLCSFFLALSLWVGPFARAEEISWPPNYGAERIHAVADLVRAQGEYIRMVGEARLAVARAMVEEAKAAYQWQLVRQLTLFVNRLQLELRNLARDEHAARNQALRLQLAAKQVKVLTHGWVSPHVLQGLRVIVAQGAKAGVVAEIMSEPVPAAAAHYFKANRKADTTLEDFPGGNLGSLFRFLEKKDYSMEPWTEPHLAIMKGLDRLSQSAEDEIKAIRAYMEEIRKGTLNLWNPPKLKPAEPPTGE